MSDVDVSIVHGPQRLDPQRCGAYHGIAPRALVDLGVDPASWPTLAPVIDETLSRCAAASDDVAVAAVDAGVLAYRDSAAAAERFVRDLLTDPDRWGDVAHGTTVEPERLELWSVREGATSSVWRVAVSGRASSGPMVFALEVARDATAAAAELVAVAAELRRMHAHEPDRVVRLLGEGTVELELAGGPARIPVVVAEWFESARELHVVDDGRWLAVDAFATCADGRQRADGELLSPARSDELWAELVRMQTAHAHAHGELVHGPLVEANDGDLVEVDDATVVVGTCGRTSPEPLGRWVARQLHPSARGANGPIEWRGAARAREAFTRAAMANPNLPPVGECLAAAREVLVAAGPGDLREGDAGA